MKTIKELDAECRAAWERRDALHKVYAEAQAVSDAAFEAWMRAFDEANALNSALTEAWTAANTPTKGDA